MSTEERLGEVERRTALDQEALSDVMSGVANGENGNTYHEGCAGEHAPIVIAS
jgi:hypothetical protein